MSRWTEAWEWGQWGERTVANWYRQQRYFVIPTSAIDNGGAPKLVGLLQSHVIPDLQASRDGRMRWVEIKYKDSPVKYQIAKEWRTGIDVDHWNAYREVERITGLPGELAMIHRRTGPRCPDKPVLLRAPFKDLDGVGSFWTYPDGSRMINWHVDRFERFPIDTDALPGISPLRTSVRPWEEKGKNGLTPGMGSDSQGMFPW